MISRYRWPAREGLLLFAILSAACSSDDGVSPPQEYAVGGTVSGIQNGAIVLRNNGNDDISVSTDGPFQFPDSLPEGSSYVIVVASPPPGQFCQVSNGSGTVGQTSVDDVVVECQLVLYTIGGVVSGLSGGDLVLQNNGDDDLSVASNGAFTFATGIASGTGYSVEVAVQPTGQECTVANGAGEVGDADVTSVAVTCEAAVYTIGGTLSGISGGTATLTNNGGDELNLAAAGDFAFATPLQDGAAYDVKVIASPAGQACTVTDGTGSVNGSDVTNVVVTCGDAYAVGGTVVGLTAGSVRIQNNGSDDLTLSQNGAFAFPTLVSDGSSYDVSVAEQPGGQVCVVVGGFGTVAGGDVTDVEITCRDKALSNRIVFHSDRDGDFEIYKMRPDGSNVIQLTDNDVDDLGPTVSPDGSRIAFWTGRDGNQEIYVMAVDGSNPTRVTVNGAADREPAWSPDGGRIAFARESGGTNEIYTIRVNGTGETRLTNNAFDDREPAWSPDGSRIAFTTDREGNDEIYLMNALDGSNQSNLTNNVGRDGKPDWSPDGTKILFDRNDFYGGDLTWVGDAEIMCMNANGSGVVRLTNDSIGAIDTRPRWSGDGSRLTLSSNRVALGVNFDIYVGNMSGCAGITNLARITTSNAKDAWSDWSP